MGRHSHLPRASALSATHSPATSQADDMRFGQLFGCVNHYAQERHDELNSTMLTILSQEPLAGTLQFACHFLTTPHTHILPAMPKHAPSHPSLTHAQAAHAHPRASHTHHATI
jgi:hypothetical protein